MHALRSETRAVGSYLAARIGIWKEKGRDELNQFLAKMGLPLQSAKMAYSMMSSDQKKSMTNYFLAYFRASAPRSPLLRNVEAISA